MSKCGLVSTKLLVFLWIFLYEISNNQGTGAEPDQNKTGLGPIIGTRNDWDRDQSLGLEMTRTNPGTIPGTVPGPGPETFSAVIWISIISLSCKSRQGHFNAHIGVCTYRKHLFGLTSRLDL